MGYNKDTYKRIRADYETKPFAARAEADARRVELYPAIPELRELDTRLSTFGLRIMEAALKVLSSFEGRKIAVLGDMLELGGMAPEAHRKVGAFAAACGVEKLFV